MAVVRVSLYLATSSLRVVLRCIPTTLSATAATQFFPKQSLHPDAFYCHFLRWCFIRALHLACGGRVYLDMLAVSHFCDI